MTEIIIKKIDEIKPYPGNPRDITNAVVMLKKSINKYGFIDPIYIDKNNEIIIGHARFQAMKELGKKEINCIVDNELSEEKKKAYRLIDNKVHEASVWSEDLLQELREFSDLEFMQQFFTEFKLDNVRKEDFEDRTNEDIQKESDRMKNIYAEFNIHKQNEITDVVCPECKKGFNIKKSDVINEIKYGKGILDES